MSLELLSVALVTFLAAAVYALFLTSLTWALELRESILKSNERSLNASVICRTCGTNFDDNCGLEDGKCQLCGRLLCSRCGLEWICPLCYKRRSEKELEKCVNIQKQEKWSETKMNNLIKMKYSNNSMTGYNNIKNPFQVPNFKNFQQQNTILHEYGVENPSDLSEEKLHKNQPFKAQNWEENWLFKRKTKPNSLKPSAMFLPSPKQNTRAKIGGIDVDDLSDLSENSDSEIQDILN